MNIFIIYFYLYFIVDDNSDKENDKDSEYLASQDEDSSDYEPSPEKHKVDSIITRSSTSSFDISQTIPSTCNDEDMNVDVSNVKSKKNYCVFCMKFQSQLARHLEKVHCDEPEVKKFAVLPKKNPERKKIIEIIRKNGNYKYNTHAEFNKGQLIVCRRPNEKWNKTAKDFTVCIKCKGFLQKMQYVIMRDNVSSEILKGIKKSWLWDEKFSAEYTN